MAQNQVKYILVFYYAVQFPKIPFVLCLQISSEESVLQWLFKE